MARKSTGGKAPRKPLKTKAARKHAPSRYSLSELRQMIQEIMRLITTEDMITKDDQKDAKYCSLLDMAINSQVGEENMGSSCSDVLEAVKLFEQHRAGFEARLCNARRRCEKVFRDAQEVQDAVEEFVYPSNAITDSLFRMIEDRASKGEAPTRSELRHLNRLLRAAEMAEQTIKAYHELLARLLKNIMEKEPPPPPTRKRKDKDEGDGGPAPAARLLTSRVRVR